MILKDSSVARVELNEIAPMYMITRAIDTNFATKSENIMNASRKRISYFKDIIYVLKSTLQYACQNL